MKTKNRIIKVIQLILLICILLSTTVYAAKKYESMSLDELDSEAQKECESIGLDDWDRRKTNIQQELNDAIRNGSGEDYLKQYIDSNAQGAVDYYYKRWAEKELENLKSDQEDIENALNGENGEEKTKLELYTEKIAEFNDLIAQGKTASDPEVQRIARQLQELYTDLSGDPSIDQNEVARLHQQQLAVGDSLEGNQHIYKNPNSTSSGNAGDSIDDIITDADAFVSQGTDRIRENKLPEFSNTVYNIALALGVAVAVIAGGFLGIKFMLGGIEEKAEIKKMLWIYIVGCITVFGSFGIWRLVVTILQKV